MKRSMYFLNDYYNLILRNQIFFQTDFLVEVGLCLSHFCELVPHLFFVSILRKSTFSKRKLVNGWVKGGGICIIICQLKGSCNSEQKKLHVTVMNFATSNFTTCRLFFVFYKLPYFTVKILLSCFCFQRRFQKEQTFINSQKFA